MASALERVRRAVRAERYRLSHHAFEELEEDGFTLADVEAGIESCTSAARQRDRATGHTKHVLSGTALDGRRISVVCRLESTGFVRVITVFEGAP